MPYLRIEYTANLEAEADMGALCKTLTRVLVEQKDEAGRAIFPPGGTRVFAYPAAYYAVADAKQDYAFVYLNLRMLPGRSKAIIARIGDAILDRTKNHFAKIFADRLIGILVHLDESTAQVYSGKHNNLNALFTQPLAPLQSRPS